MKGNEIIGQQTNPHTSWSSLVNNQPTSSLLLDVAEVQTQATATIKMRLAALRGNGSGLTNQSLEIKTLQNKLVAREIYV